MLLVGVLAASTASIFIRLAQADAAPLAIAAWRLTLASLLLAPLALARYRRELASFSDEERRLALAGGAMLAAHFATWISSLALTSVAASVVLVTTTPLFVGLFGYLFLGESLSFRLVVGLLLAMVGAIVIGVGDAAGGTHQLTGDFLALGGAVTAAVYLLVGRRLRARLSLVGYIFPVYGTAALFLLALALIQGAPLGGYAPLTWLWLLLLALVPQLVGHSSLNWALGHLPATYVSLAVLGEPIGSTLLAWWLLQEAPPSSALGGGLLILLGLVLAGRPPRRAATPAGTPSVNR